MRYLLALLSLLALGACPLLGLGDTPCEQDSNCPAGQHCSADGICVDGAPASDAGPADGASEDAPGADAASADAGSADSAPGVDSSSGSDAASVDSAVADGASSDAGVAVDAASGDAAGATLCAVPPCSPMPDSITDFCRLGATDGGTCPGSGTDYYGQDSNHHLLTPSYTAPTAGVVADTITGLMWESTASFSDRSWAQGVAYCEGLQLGGHDDWRLPSFRELITLVDYGRAYPEAAIDTMAFATPVRDWFWSSSGINGFYWVVDFWGFLHPQIQLNQVSPGTVGAVRCVRGAAQVEGELVFSAGTWTDQRSGLVWQANSLTDITWVDALASCEALTLAGHDDWRLPSIKELETLVDRNTDASSYTFEPLRSETGGETYWSSTPYRQDYGIWAIMFNSGRYVNRYPASPYRARCVRGP